MRQARGATRRSRSSGSAGSRTPTRWWRRSAAAARHHRRRAARRSPIPFLPNKIEEGRLDEIRECIGCNVCVSRVGRRRRRSSAPRTPPSGEEYRRGWHPEQLRAGEQRRPRRARRRRRPGRDGVRDRARQARHAPGPPRRGRTTSSAAHALDPRLPGLGEWGRVVDYRRIQLEKLSNVEVVLETRLRPRTCSPTAPRSSSSRPARAGRRRHERPDPGADPRRRRRPTSTRPTRLPRPAGRSTATTWSSTTPTATSPRWRWPSC